MRETGAMSRAHQGGRVDLSLTVSQSHVTEMELHFVEVGCKVCWVNITKALTVLLSQYIDQHNATLVCFPIFTCYKYIHLCLL